MQHNTIDDAVVEIRSNLFRLRCPIFDLLVEALAHSSPQLFSLVAIQQVYCMREKRHDQVHNVLVSHLGRPAENFGEHFLL